MNNIICCCVYFSAIIVIIVIYNLSTGVTLPSPAVNVNTQHIVKQPKSANITKKILFWNQWWFSGYGFGNGRAPFLKHCKVNACETISNVTQIAEADAIIYWASKYRNKENLPLRTNEEQVLIFFETEPAVFTYGRKFPNVNATISYRRDSTIPSIYGYYRRRETKDGLYVPLNNTQIKRKTKMASWMISHCNRTTNVRQTYVRQLQKYMKVDIFGKGGCGKNQNESCSKGCMDKLETNYKFFLAFENSHCRDYVTEKAFRTLSYNLVPVEMGGADYKKILPPHSFIHAHDFKSPKELADYLKLVSQNPDMYRKYLAWKHKYVIYMVPNTVGVFCKLCEHLWNPGTLFNRNIDTTKWWSGDTCITNRTQLLKYYHIDDDSLSM